MCQRGCQTKLMISICSIIVSFSRRRNLFSLASSSVKKPPDCASHILSFGSWVCQGFFYFLKMWVYSLCECEVQVWQSELWHISKDIYWGVLNLQDSTEDACSNDVCMHLASFINVGLCIGSRAHLVMAWLKTDLSWRGCFDTCLAYARTWSWLGRQPQVQGSSVL